MKTFLFILMLLTQSAVASEILEGEFILTEELATSLDVNSELEYGDWTKFQELGDVDLFQKLGTLNNKTVEKLVSAHNQYNVSICILSKVVSSVNAEGFFYDEGKAIVPAGEKIILGGYRAKNVKKGWRVRWEYRGTKNLKRCQ